MKKSFEPIVFFGSGPVAAKSLEFLHDNFIVNAVVTKPIPPHHHEAAPVAEFARDKSLKTYLVRDKYELDDLILSKNSVLDVRIGVLVDFGIIVSKSVLDHFELGVINSHFSLLPEWRGADPITFSILSGQRETGVSLMVVVEAMDEGPIIAQRSYKLSPNTTTPELTNNLIKLSNRMLAMYLSNYIGGKLQPTPQDTSIQPSYSRKLVKQDGQINPEKNAAQLEREIRAFIDWPKSQLDINGLVVTVRAAHTVSLSGKPGTFEIVNKELILHCGKQSLAIDSLRPAGKRDMSSADFLRGYKDRLDMQ
jgi:methionyl-tRNA formyltransferase